MEQKQNKTAIGRTGGGGMGVTPVPLLPSKKWPCSLKQNLDFHVPCSPNCLYCPVPYIFRPLFPCSPKKWAFFPYSPKPLRGPHDCVKNHQKCTAVSNERKTCTNKKRGTVRFKSFIPVLYCENIYKKKKKKEKEKKNGGLLGGLRKNGISTALHIKIF